VGELKHVGSAVEDSEVGADERVTENPQGEHLLSGVEGEEAALALIGEAVAEGHTVGVLLGEFRSKSRRREISQPI